MLNISYSSVFVDSSGDNSLYAVCSRLEICTVHWVSLVPGYLWSRYLHFSCQQEKKLLSLFSWMWELTNFFSSKFSMICFLAFSQSQFFTIWQNSQKTNIDFSLLFPFQNIHFNFYMLKYVFCQHWSPSNKEIFFSHKKQYFWTKLRIAC